MLKDAWVGNILQARRMVSPHFLDLDYVGETARGMSYGVECCHCGTRIHQPPVVYRLVKSHSD
jgi:hypothetical protein